MPFKLIESSAAPSFKTVLKFKLAIFWHLFLIQFCSQTYEISRMVLFRNYVILKNRFSLKADNPSKMLSVKFWGKISRHDNTGKENCSQDISQDVNDL